MKRFFIVLLGIVSFLLIILFLFVLILYLQSFSVKLDESKLNKVQNNISYFDNANSKIESEDISMKHIDGKVPKRFTEFLTLIEDREFFNHKGINVKRMFTALFKNIQSMSFKQGASTITQQVIKNTHLTSEKTLKRKFIEIRLSRELEKKYTKDEILKMYVNVIYFGSGFYGLESASYGYFGKSAYDLSDNECALLVGLIKAPTRYSPINNYEKSIKRKNFVLKVALENNLITNEEYIKNVNEDIILVDTKVDNYKESYLEGVKEEVIDVLNLEKEEFSLNKYKVFTYYDDEIQRKISSKHKEIDYEKNKIFDSATLVLDNKQNGIAALYHKNKGSMKNIKRQIGSIMKPLFVYAPAFENKVVYPVTFLLDEKINYGDYCPKNFDNSYDGYITVKEALKRSKNIPSIKLLEYVGIDNAKSFIYKLGIDLYGEENTLSLALGGTNSGIDIFSIVNAYATFAKNGRYSKGKFIKKILDENGKTIYENTLKDKQVIKSSTSYLISDILGEASKTGTGRIMKDIGFSVATKTGTVGDENGNSDAYSVSYNGDYTTCTHLFSKDNNELMEKNILGGNIPTNINRDIYLDMKNTGKIISYEFEQPSSIVWLKLDKYSFIYENKIELANSITPIEHYIMQCFDKENTPYVVSDRFRIPKIENFEMNLLDDIITLEFDTMPYYYYDVYLVNEDEKILLETIKTSKKRYRLEKKLELNTLSHFEIIPYFYDGKEKIMGDILVSDRLLI